MCKKITLSCNIRGYFRITPNGSIYAIYKQRVPKLDKRQFYPQWCGRNCHGFWELPHQLRNSRGVRPFFFPNTLQRAAIPPSLITVCPRTLRCGLTRPLPSAWVSMFWFRLMRRGVAKIAMWHTGSFFVYWSIFRVPNHYMKSLGRHISKLTVHSIAITLIYERKIKKVGKLGIIV